MQTRSSDFEYDLVEDADNLRCSFCKRPLNECRCVTVTTCKVCHKRTDECTCDPNAKFCSVCNQKIVDGRCDCCPICKKYPCKCYTGGSGSGAGGNTGGGSSSGGGTASGGGSSSGGSTGGGISGGSSSGTVTSSSATSASTITTTATKPGESGHVVVVVPGEAKYSYSWGGYVPCTMDTGYKKRTSKTTLNYSFGNDKKNQVHFYIYKK